MKPQSQSFRPLPIDVAPAHTQRQMIIGYCLAALGALLFSLKGIFIKYAYADVPTLDALTLMAIRMGISLPLYGIILIWSLRRRKTKEIYKDKPLSAAPILIAPIIIAMGTGVIGYYIAAYLDFEGLQHITAQLERLILYTYPGFVMVLGALFFSKKITMRGILYMGLAYCGLAFIFARGEIAEGEGVLLGTVLVTGAALSFALFQLLAAEQIKNLGASLFTCVAMIGAGIGILLQYSLREMTGGGFGVLQSLPASIWLIGIGIAVLSTLLPSFLVNIALGRIGAQAVSIVGMVSPLMTIVLAVTILGEPFSLVDGVGTLLTLTGIGLFTFHMRQGKKINS